MASEMIERVARAIYLADPHLNAGEIVRWEELRGPLKDMSYTRARAAIEALTTHELLKELDRRLGSTPVEE